MLSEAITMTAMTHPLQALLIGMIVSRLARAAFRTATATGPVAPIAEYFVETREAA